MSKETRLFGTLLNEAVYASGNIHSFPAETIILNIHSYIRSIPIVLSGSIKVVRTDEDGQELLLYYIKPGESCIMSFLAGLHNDKSKVKAVVEEDAEILMIPVENVGKWIREFPEWTDFIFSLYQKRFEELLEVVNAVAFQKMDARIISLLHQKSALYNSIDISITHQQLAEELGTTREAASRVLKQLERSGKIKLSRNKISLL
jgi:CRP/FNR family transcriptional regulator